MALFYVHPFPVDMSYLVHCPSSRIAQRVSEYGEVQAYRALRNDVRRTRNASLATFFYMPIWEWTSVRSGACNGTTHRERMNAVAKYLSESALYRRFASRHFWLTSAAQASAIDTAIASERGDLQNRLYDLFDVLKPAIAGERKVMRKLTSTASKAVFEIPYGTPSVRRPELYFAGSFDVCCTGARLRCKLATLSSHPAFRLLSTPRANSTPGRCGANVPVGDTAVTARLYTERLHSCDRGACEGRLPQQGRLRVLLCCGQALRLPPQSERGPSRSGREYHNGAEGRDAEEACGRAGGRPVERVQSRQQRACHP